MLPDSLKELLVRRPRVAFFCPVWARRGPLQLGWSDYWRLALPAIELHRKGWNVVLGREIGPGENGRLKIRDPDGVWWEDREILVFHRWMSEHAPRLIRSAREAGQVLVNDVDDLLWDMPVDHPGRRQMSLPDHNVENWLETLGESSLLLASTPYLADALKKLDLPPVRVVRNYVDLSAWEPRPPGRYVGWVGSTAGRSMDLEVMRPVVSYLRERGEPLYHGGLVPGEPHLEEMLGPPVVTRPFQPPTLYPRLWDPLRIALCPLGDHPFSRGKSWVKALEACARGIPFIASNSREYQELGCGRLAATPDEWVWHLKALEDPETYATDCEVNRRRAEKLNIAQRVDEWEAILKEAPTTPRREHCPSILPTS